MRLQTKTLFIIIFSLLIILLFSVFSCSDIFDSMFDPISGYDTYRSKPDNNAKDKGIGYFTITRSGANIFARTLMPENPNKNDFKYRLNFTPVLPGNANNSIVIQDYVFNDVITLPVGEWTLVVTAFGKADAYTGTATYQTPSAIPLTISEGALADINDTSITLNHLLNNGNGFLKYKIIWPDAIEPNAGGATIKITPMAGGNAATYNLTNGEEKTVALGNGFHEIIVTIASSSGRAGDIETAKIERNLTTAYEKTFEIEKFIEDLPNTASITVSPTAQANLWVNQTLTATPSGFPDGTVKYVWKRIKNDTETFVGSESTYEIQIDDIGGVITVSAYISNYNGAKTSASTAQVPDLIGIYNKNDQLAKIGMDYPLDGNYFLVENIDVSGTPSLNNWTPIGNNTNRFTGIFDGNGKIISALNINRSASFQGLFGAIDRANVKNVGLNSVNITVTTVTDNDPQNVGALVGANYGGTIENCFANVNITTGGTNQGGLVGRNDDSGQIKNCYTTGSITSTGTSGNIGIDTGGILGYNVSGTVIYCYSTATIKSSNTHTGGIVGAGGTNTVQDNVALNLSITGTNFRGRVYGGNHSGTETLLWNYARNDMIIYDTAGNQLTSITGADYNTHGEDVTPGVTTLSEVFANFASGPTDQWQIPQNNDPSFDVSKRLPRLRVFGTSETDNPYPLLPGNDVAMIQETGERFATLTEAIQSANGGTSSTIIILSNINTTTIADITNDITIINDGTPRTISLSYDGLLLKITGGKLTLKGTSSTNTLTLQGRDNNTATLIMVNNGGTLVLEDGLVITGNKRAYNDSNASQGGGVFIETGGTFIMNGGVIENNSAGKGGGVYLDAGTGTFTMTGGSIRNNYGYDGGGVWIGSGRTMEMSGGRIEGNIATYGFGGGVHSFGTFTMSGGYIYGTDGTQYNPAGTPNVSNGAAFYRNGGTAEYIGAYLPSTGTNAIAFTSNQANTTLPAKNTVTVNRSPVVGTASASPASARVGETVSLTASLPTGYTFENWTVNSGGITITNPTNRTGATFVMPNNAVTVQANYNPIKYTVTYNANGGTGSMANTTHTYGSPTALRTNAFTRTGYTFAGWNSNSGGTGTSYTDGQSVLNLTSTQNGSVTLYAQWTPITYTVTYNGNGSTGGSTASSSHIYGVAKTLTPNGFTRTGYTFAGWSTSSGTQTVVYTDGQSVTNLRDTAGTTTLYAQWTPVYTVTFVANGTTVATRQVLSGSTVGAANMPANPGDVPSEYNCKFNKWVYITTTTISGVPILTMIDFTGATIVTGNMSVTAQYRPYELGETGPGGGKIFHVDSGGFYYLDRATGTNKQGYYLEAAPADISSTRAWATSATATNNVVAAITASTAIGAGSSNTFWLLNYDASAPAAKACNDYTNNGKSDWYLPSQGELMYLITRSSYVDNFTSNGYWSSTTYSYDYSYALMGSYSYPTGNPATKGTLYRVRPVRAF